jgi:hypothetical protein
MIRIVNLRNYRPVEGEVLIKVDRTSPVGNPFYMSDESRRDEVCDKYEAYFNNPARHTSLFRYYLNDIIGTARNHNVALGCWCAPKRCHAETIKAYVEKVLKGEA